jgi:LDH2 family malate/lactate/ureidoglycolate dehydrogenase
MATNIQSQSAGAGSTRTRFPAGELIDFTARILARCGMTEENARTAATVLLDADLMGVDSHGIAHLATHGSYISGLQSGRINPRPNIQIVRETASTALVDGDGGFGTLVGYNAMQIAMRKAKEAGSGSVTVRNSRHFGAAGYYALMAAREDLIGMSMTNSGPWMTPTFAKKKMIGTNPIAIAAPAGREQPFLIDMATSTVAMGKVEIAEREEKDVPEGWGVDAEGRPTTDIDTIRHRGGLTPLGGTPTTSSYKGYALGVVVDILCGVLSGAGYSMIVSSSTGVGHFFAAWNVEAFQPLDEFKATMDEMQKMFRTAEPVEGAERVLLPGQREFETRAERERLGIPLHFRVVQDLERLAGEFGIAPPKPV